MGPLLRLEVEVEEVVQLASAIVTTEKVHPLPQNRGGGSVAGLRPQPVPSYLQPLIRSKREFVQVIAVVSVITTENVKLIIKDHGRMRMPWAGTSFRVNHFL